MCVAMAAEVSDEVLAARAQAGDAGAFEQLVRGHADRLHAVVQRLVNDEHEAQEVTQETFLRAWRGLGGFKGDAQFFTWLYRIGINEAKRRATRRPPAEARDSEPGEEEPLATALDWREAPETRLAQGELRGVLEREIRALPLDYRATIILRDVEGLSTREAAEVMELSEAAFKSRLHRARLTVHEALDDYFPEMER